jgi:hypothetical protein
MLAGVVSSASGVPRPSTTTWCLTPGWPRSVGVAPLTQARARGIAESEELARPEDALKAANAALWEIEHAIRVCERDGEFGPRFVELARAVYQQNDARAALKRQIDRLLGRRSASRRTTLAPAARGTGRKGNPQGKGSPER